MASSPDLSSWRPSKPRLAQMDLHQMQMNTVREYELTTLYVDFGHLQRDDVLVDTIQKQYYRFSAIPP